MELLTKITNNKETLQKIIQMVGTDPSIGLFLTVDIVNKNKKITTKKIVKSPFGEHEQEETDYEKIAVREKIDSSVLLGLATQWLASLDARALECKEFILKEIEQSK